MFLDFVQVADTGALVAEPVADALVAVAALADAAAPVAVALAVAALADAAASAAVALAVVALADAAAPVAVV